MKHKIRQQAMTTIQQTNVPILIVFIVFASIFWFFNKMSHTYSTTTTLPVIVENSADNTVGVINPRHEVEVRIEGQGYRLLSYKYFPERNAVRVNIRRLDIQNPEQNGIAEITSASLFNAMSDQLSDVKLLAVLTPRFDLVLSDFRTKTLPVRSRITVDYRNQYVQIGPVHVVPESMEVKSLGIILDTMQAVYTEERHFSNVSGTLTGRVPLTENPEVIYPVDEVTYSVTIEEFTEVDLKLPVEAINIPAGYDAVVLPGDVIVRLNVSRSNYSNASVGDIRAYIDYEDRRSNISNEFKIYIDHEQGIEVKDQSARYVELLLEQHHD